jgi:hypothetical protein
MVPFEVVQQLLTVAMDQQIPLKKIEYRYHFQSSQNPTEMQIGSSGACTKAPVIPAQALKEAISARSDEEFQKAISAFKCQPSPATQAKVKQRTR